MKKNSLSFLLLLLVFVQTKSLSQTYDVLADGVTYEGFSSTVFYLNDSATDNYKIIRNCTFKNATSGAIWLFEVHHIIIENCTFENISTATGSVEHIGIKIADNCDNIIIRDCIFKNVGADAIQMWHFPTNVQILNNEIWVEDGVEAENAIDVKSTTGPILIKGNNIHGFRPVDNPPLSSSGEGIVIHGVGTGYAQHVYVAGNRIWDNTSGIVCGSAGPESGSPDKIIFRNNIIYNNLNTGMLISEENGRDVDVSHNTFYNNTNSHLYVYGATDDRFSNNLFVGTGTVGANSGTVTTILNNNNLILTDTADAKFVDISTLDFHLQFDSPAVDSGAPTLGFLWTDEGLTTDIDGDARPMGTSVDYGANEYFVDTSPPVPDLANLPNITAECEVSVLTPPTATDNVDGSITATTDATLPITTQGTTVITWTYTDAAGNTTTQTQDIIIDDTTAPVVIGQNYTALLTGSSVNIPVSSVDNGSYDNCGNMSLTLNPNTFYSTGTYQATLSGVDANMNESETIVTITVISTVGIDDQENDQGIKVYPNPITTKLNITSNEVIEYFDIYNSLGQRVLRKFVNSNSLQLDITSLPDTVYFLEIYGAHTIRYKKIIKKPY